MRGAVCVRCGAFRGHYRDVCPSCGHAPTGDGVLVAWLLSDEHLDEAALAATAQRIASGQTIRPTPKMLRKARRALGQDFSTDPGLTSGQRLGLLATSFFVTPLVGWTLWLWWRNTRPRASVQALLLSAPASVILFVAVIVLWAR